MKKVKTIFLVDDDAEDRMLISEAMRNVITDVNIVEAASGTELIELLTGKNPRHNPAVILMDMNMPRLSGLETLSFLKLDPCFQHIPVVMVSTTAEQNLISKAYAKGINAFITKPVTTNEYLLLAQAVNVCFLNNNLTDNDITLGKSLKSKNIIIIEDNADHRELMNFALKQTMPNAKAHILKDRESTLAFLANQYPGLTPSPEFILLDLYLPDRGDGLQLLDEIRSFIITRGLKNVPIIVFSHSDHDEDIKAAYSRKANAYMVKPPDVGNWLIYFQNLCHFWSNTISLPKA